MTNLLYPLLLATLAAHAPADRLRPTLVADAMPAAPIAIENAWARPTAPAAKMGVVYMTIANHGPADDTLTAVSTPAADAASLHISKTVDGVSQMRALPSVAVKPGIDVSFAPGGMHVMLEGLKGPLVAGSSFPLTLHFAKAGDVATTVAIKQNGEAMADMPGMKM